MDAITKLMDLVERLERLQHESRMVIRYLDALTTRADQLRKEIQQVQGVFIGSARERATDEQRRAVR